LIDWLTAHLS